jgi:hypothetical protein
VTDLPLAKPDHLDARRQRVAAWIALAIGATSLVVALALYGGTAWLTVPAAALAAIAAATSFARRERAYALCAVGVGLAGAAIVVTWVIAVVIVLGITLAAIAILHHVL